MNRRDFNSSLVALFGSSAGFMNLVRHAAAQAGDNLRRVPAVRNLTPPSLENQFRGYIVDHHSPDPPAITYANFDPDQWFRLYEEALLDHVWVFYKGHHGEAYYPTKVGHEHPGLKIDFVHAFSERLKRKGIAFHAYYCIGFDDWAVLNHPAWALLGEDGANRRVEPKENWHSMGQWHWACVNTPYRQYVLQQLTEIVQGYAPDGLFLDIVGQPLCYCADCSRLYRSRYGHEIPRGAAAVRDWQETSEFLYQTTQLGFVKEVISTVRGLGSRAAITINGGHLVFRSELMDLLDYTFAEPFAGNYLSAMFARGTGKLPQIGPGLVAWPYDPSPASVFQAEAAMIAAQNCRVFMYSETMHQDGSLDPLWFREMGAGYKDIEQIQPYLVDRDSVSSVAIVFSEKTRFKDRLDVPGILKGAMEASACSHFPSDILPDRKLTAETLRAYGSVVLPEVSILSPEEVEALTEFVEGGGLLIATGVSGTRDTNGQARANFAIADLIGCDFEAKVETYAQNLWGSYLERSNDEFWKALPDATFAVEPPLVRVKPRAGAKVLATHTLPATVWKKDTDHDEQDWVNWEPPPPGKTTPWPAIVETARGKGKTVYLSFDLYGMVSRGFRWPLELHSRLLRSSPAAPPLRVEIDDRAGVGTTFYKRREKAELIVHQINRTVPLRNGEVTPIPGGRLILNPSYFQATACSQVFPSRRDLPLVRGAGSIEVQLPEVGIHSVVTLQS
ncbi:MAG TPA: alpha-amylase family protein [Acidobacteriaceae bacterium]|nr:alpha-amylase family protein [Acidobacteriaceae bacterium]